MRITIIIHYIELITNLNINILSLPIIVLLLQTILLIFISNTFWHKVQYSNTNRLLICYLFLCFCFSPDRTSVQKGRRAQFQTSQNCEIKVRYQIVIPHVRHLLLWSLTWCALCLLTCCVSLSHRSGSVVAEIVVEYNYPNNDSHIQLLNTRIDEELAAVFSPPALAALGQSLGNVTVELGWILLQPTVIKSQWRYLFIYFIK